MYPRKDQLLVKDLISVSLLSTVLILCHLVPFNILKAILPCCRDHPLAWALTLPTSSGNTHLSPYSSHISLLKRWTVQSQLLLSGAHDGGEQYLRLCVGRRNLLEALVCVS